MASSTQEFGKAAKRTNFSTNTSPKRHWLSTARVTALLYLALAISGIFGYVVTGEQLYVAGDASATLTNMLENQTLMRIGLIGKLGVIAYQTLVALWFYKLFRNVNSFAAGSLAALGLMGAASVLIALVFSMVALQVALNPIAGSDSAATVLLLWQLHEAAWGAGGLFFGLWLLPMGLLVLYAQMPRALGWILVTGGVAYVISTLLKLIEPSWAGPVIAVLPWFAAVGEFWIIGYLLVDRGGKYE